MNETGRKVLNASKAMPREWAEGVKTTCETRERENESKNSWFLWPLFYHSNHSFFLSSVLSFLTYYCKGISDLRECRYSSSLPNLLLNQSGSRKTYLSSFLPLSIQLNSHSFFLSFFLISIHPSFGSFFSSHTIPFHDCHFVSKSLHKWMRERENIYIYFRERCPYPRFCKEPFLTFFNVCEFLGKRKITLIKNVIPSFFSRYFPGGFLRTDTL